MFPPVLVMAPAAKPTDAATVKARVAGLADADDAVVSALIDVVTAHLDGWSGILGRCLVTQSWRQDYRCFGPCMRLPFPDVAVTEVAYYDVDDVKQTVDQAAYETVIDAKGPFVRFKSAFAVPVINDDRITPVQITFTAGYGDATKVPAPIVQAIAFMVGGLYRPADEAFQLRGETVDGVGERQYSSPEILRQATEGMAGMLLSPYRRLSL